MADMIVTVFSDCLFQDFNAVSKNYSSEVGYTDTFAYQ